MHIDNVIFLILSKIAYTKFYEGPFVIEFEIQRLVECTLIPKRISVIDVSAGYDILSCNNSSSATYDRYIELKSFRGSPHFYWSSNEKRIAEALGENYFLYLVDLSAVEQNREGYTPQIIPNPAINLCSDDWLIEPNSYRIVSAIIEHFFQKKAGLYHYLSTAKKNYREYNDCFEAAPVAEDRATSLAREVCKLQATPKCRKSLPDVDTLALAGTPGYHLRQGLHLLT